MKGRVVYGRENRYYLEDKEVTQAEFDAAFKSRLDTILESGVAPGGQRPACWPMESDALAVHPRQARAFQEDSRKMGVPTEFTPAGSPVFTDQGHRSRYLAAYGKFDRNGSYGDYTGHSRVSERQQMQEEVDAAGMKDAYGEVEDNGE